MPLSKMASAIYNDVVSGLSGIGANPNISLDQLEDEIVDERLAVIKQYAIKNLIPKKDLMYAINCIPVDCESLDKCCIRDKNSKSQPVAHFELPQFYNDFGNEAIDYIGTTDKQIQYKVYTDPTAWTYNQYKRRGSTRPFVYIQTTPNEHNMYDAWIFNSPLIKKVSAIIIPKDIRQLTQYACCTDLEERENFTFIHNEVKKNVTEKKLRYYRQLFMPPTPNTQMPK